jgi:hypothetical protein
MPIPEPKLHQPAIRKILLATGTGAIFGFQLWRLAKYGFAISIPWQGSVWIFFSQVFLGFSIGIFELGKWWKRGPVFGLFLGISCAFGANALGLKWAPYGVVSIAASLVDGLLIAFFADNLFPRTVASTDRQSPTLGMSSASAGAQAGIYPAKTLRERLAEGKVSLERLDADRERRGDSEFGKTTEDRIVWGELIELELQDIDEQLHRICGSRSPQTPLKSNLRKGGSHEHNDS